MSFKTFCLPFFLSALLLLGSQAGCGSGEKAPTSDIHGPHGGHTLAMSRDTDYQLEFTLDDSRRKIVIYAYEKTSRSPYPIAASQLDASIEFGGTNVELTFDAEPRSSDPEGSSSRFSISLDDLPQQLISANRFSIDVSIADGGEKISATMEHNNDHRHDYHHD